MDELRLAAVPLDSEEGRALLQRRIALFSRTAMLVSLAFLVTGNLLAIFLAQVRPLSVIGQTSTWYHAAATAVLLGVWLVARRGKLHTTELFWLDLAGALLSMALYSAMALSAFRALPERMDLLLLLILLTVTMLRATIVPSSPRATALISTAAGLPAVGVAWAVGSSVGMALGAAVNGAIWAATAVFTSTLASRVIYGLRSRAADAERLGQYVLDAKIGEGGMGSVYRARHALLRRPTAIKLLPRDKAGEHAISRFEREVQHTSALTHPNTVSIYDYGRTPEGVFYYAMEYLEGLDLQKLVDRFGPQPPARVVHVLRQVCGALAEAHERGIIHRDVKPANVILCERGGIPDVAKVVDFGLAKDVSQSGDALVTQLDAIIGTPLYMAPEAITAPDEVDARSDLYALGAVAYFLLTGVQVFTGASLVEICNQHLHETPLPPSVKLGKDLPRELEDLVLACLAKKKEDRPASARALGTALAACDVEPWTEERAREWWLENAARAGASESQESLERGRTVAVDFATRAEE